MNENTQAKQDPIHYLFQVMCSDAPSFKQVTDLLLKEYRCSFYAIIQKPLQIHSYHVVSSNILTFSISDDSLFSADKLTITNYSSPQKFNGIPNIRSIMVTPILPDYSLVLCSEKPLKSADFANDKLSPFILVLKTLISRMEIDQDFIVSKADTFNDDKMQSLSIRGYNVQTEHPSELFINTFAMFHKSGISSKIGISPNDLLDFLVQVRHYYNPVPYHNWFHALDVTQFVYSVISKVKLNEILNDNEIFALLLAAITHDTEHNGLTNVFHRNTNSVYAHLSNGMPPLEHHHSEMACVLAKKMFQSLPEAQRDEVTRFMVSCIMATNMEVHKKFLEDFQKVQGNFDKTVPEQRLLLAQIILKAADLSNTVRDFNAAEEMSSHLTTECFRQGDIEVSKGLTVSPMCDRNTKDPLCKGQVGFYQFVAGPLMKELHTFFPQLADNAEAFEENLEKWKEMLSKFQAQNPN